MNGHEFPVTPSPSDRPRHHVFAKRATHLDAPFEIPVPGAAVGKDDEEQAPGAVRSQPGHRSRPELRVDDELRADAETLRVACDARPRIRDGSSDAPSDDPDTLRVRRTWAPCGEQTGGKEGENRQPSQDSPGCLTRSRHAGTARRLPDRSSHDSTVSMANRSPARISEPPPEGPTVRPPGAPPSRVPRSGSHSHAPPPARSAKRTLPPVGPDPIQSPSPPGSSGRQQISGACGNAGDRSSRQSPTPRRVGRRPPR